jgi:hypothetical protein
VLLVTVKLKQLEMKFSSKKSNETEKHTSRSGNSIAEIVEQLKEIVSRIEPNSKETRIITSCIQSISSDKIIEIQPSVRSSSDISSSDSEVSKPTKSNVPAKLKEREDINDWYK